MAQTYAQLQKQINQLQRLADKQRSDEVPGVIERIKHAIEVYGLTPEQLGFGGVTSPAESTAPVPKPISQQAPKPLVKSKNASKSKPQFGGFGDKSGNIWSGRGPRPAWLRDALLAGHNKNEFRLGNGAQPAKTVLSLPTAAAAVTAVATPTPSVSPTVSPPANAARKRPSVSYADDAGHVWSGMGPMPRWLKDSIAAGKSLADFAR
jgi:DNA-binding protein H-NS